MQKEVVNRIHKSPKGEIFRTMRSVLIFKKDSMVLMAARWIRIKNKCQLCSRQMAKHEL